MASYWLHLYTLWINNNTFRYFVYFIDIVIWILILPHTVCRTQSQDSTPLSSIKATSHRRFNRYSALNAGKTGHISFELLNSPADDDCTVASACASAPQSSSVRCLTPAVSHRSRAQHPTWGCELEYAAAAEIAWNIYDHIRASTHTNNTSCTTRNPANVAGIHKYLQSKAFACSPRDGKEYTNT